MVHDVELDIDHDSSWNMSSVNRYVLCGFSLDDWNRCVETKGLSDAHRQVFHILKIVPEILSKSNLIKTNQIQWNLIQSDLLRCNLNYSILITYYSNLF